MKNEQKMLDEGTNYPVLNVTDNQQKLVLGTRAVTRQCQMAFGLLLE